MKQINTGGTNYQVGTGEKNTNFIGGEHHHHYPQPQPNSEPRRFTIPYARNPYFTGRATILTQIHESLSQTGAAAINQARAISGLGGVGKTQTAVEYAYRYFEDEPTYEWVLWVNASDLTLAASFGSIATDLALPNHATNKLDENIAAVCRWLETHDRWLLIFDNVDDPKSLKPFRPKNPNGRILLTSRAQRFENLGVANPIPIHEMTPTEADNFLQHRTERTVTDPTETQAIVDLAKQLCYLPLALEQAAAYIQTKNVSFAAYLRSYQKRRLQVLEKEKPQTGDYPDSVATTWAINFAAVKQSNLAAADLLTLSAFLAPDNIPYELLTLGKDHLGDLLSEALADAAEDELVLPDLLEELTRYSLIRLEADNRYSIHRLVQEVLRDGLDEPTRQQWQTRTVEALNQAFPSVEFKNWMWCERLVEQVQAIEQDQVPQTLTLALLLNQTGYFLYEQGRFSEAEPLYLQALQIRKIFIGESYPHVATSLNNLAELYKAQGRYIEAEPLCRQAWQLSRTLLGKSHPDVATSLNNLAGLYRAQGHYEKAKPIYQQVLQMRRTLLGESHPHVAASLNNLAELYRTQGCYEDAEPLFLQALQMKRTLLGEKHPDVATSLNNLALLYYFQGRYESAESLLQEALHMTKSLLGETHPDVAATLNNLAVLYRTQRCYEKAESLYQQVLQMKRILLGENHPDVALSLNNLAGLYYFQERYEVAEPLFLQALQMRKTLLGATHPDVIQSLNNLAELYRIQGFYKKAEPLLLQAMAILTESLGETHPNTQTVWQNFVYCLQQAIEEGQTAQLSDHPTTQAVLAQLRTQK